MIPVDTPLALFTGKGGVGKTSVACATAVRMADQGRRVLLVSTDPASNLGEVLEVDLGRGDPVAVPGAPGLFARDIDPEMAARRYRERVIGPYRGVLPDAALASIEEQLSGACTVEVAAFDEFARLLADPRTDGFDHVILDTAPTGHTLRLLELPSAWTGFFEANTTGTSCLGPLAGLEAERDTYARALGALRDPAVVEVVIVARPDRASLREAARASAELGALCVPVGRLVVNGVPTLLDPMDPVARAIARTAQEALADLPSTLADLPSLRVPLAPRPPMGVDGLRRFGAPEIGGYGAWCGDVPVLEAATATDSHRGGWEAMVDDLAAEGRGVVLTMGKGGVGKTHVATRVARALAERGHAVHLTTTDPAGCIGEESGRDFRLRTSRIDPEAVTEAYREEVLASAGASLDAAGRALLEEDLRSPCTEEIAVFRAFADAVAGGEDAFVVIDTAPTGHTLLLMDAAEAYHREVLRKPGSAPDAVRRLLPRLRDPAFARVLVVALPEPTPVHEAARLQEDLRRAGIEPFAWVVNQCLTGLELRDPFLVRRRAGEAPLLDEVRSLSRLVVLSSWTDLEAATSPPAVAVGPAG